MITTISNFRAKMSMFMDAVVRDSQEVIISRGEESVALIPIEEYNSMKETEYLMSSEKMSNIILKGMEDVKNGNYRMINIDEL